MGGMRQCGRDEVPNLEIVGKKTKTANLDGLADLLARSTEVDECLKQIYIYMLMELHDW